ncbi:hypothetical protein [Mesobacillus stamsii]|uniref:FtsH-binding integral membrane protein n=1 Tax=Mesobacillus stamsii TaxID=225347 RepID=A0ABU0FXJ3_9BACI|nr:hypothetical protein [Mesobacillus stamsii]MDQ0414068.1 FtsH-binding integral membrane protein [Mesobacillus stamsii]
MKIFLDLRVNIGLVLTIIGIIIFLTGLITKPELESLHGVNINLIWGIVTTIVGAFFLGLYFKNPDQE